MANDPALNKEYLPIDGIPEFCDLSAKLIFGANSPAIGEKRVTLPLHWIFLIFSLFL